MAIGSSADLWVHLMKTCPIYVSNEACLGRYAIIFMIILFSFNTHCNSRFPQWWFSLNYHYILMKVQDGVQGMARTWFWTRLFMYYDNNTYCNSSICSFLTKNKQEIFQNVLLIVTKQYHKCTVFKPSFLLGDLWCVVLHSSELWLVVLCSKLVVLFHAIKLNILWEENA